MTVKHYYHLQIWLEIYRFTVVIKAEQKSKYYATFVYMPGCRHTNTIYMGNIHYDMRDRMVLRIQGRNLVTRVTASCDSLTRHPNPKDTNPYTAIRPSSSLMHENGPPESPWQAFTGSPVTPTHTLEEEKRTEEPYWRSFSHRTSSTTFMPASCGTTDRWNCGWYKTFLKTHIVALLLAFDYLLKFSLNHYTNITYETVMWRVFMSKKIDKINRSEWSQCAQRVT